MYAILRAGGKQVKVSPGDVVRIEKPSGGAEKGQKLTLSEVVFAGGADKPAGRNVTITATVLGGVRSRKVLVFKKKRTKQYRRTKGHRQNLVEVRIDSIEA